MITGRPCNLIAQGFRFAPDGHALYIQAPDSGRTSLYKLGLLPNAEPQLLFRGGSVTAYHDLRQGEDDIGKLLITASSFVEPWLYQISDTSATSEELALPRDVSRASQHIALGLSQKQVSEMYFEGAGDYVVQAWVIKPRGFDPSKKRYPLCLLVHDGPNNHWADAWSTQVSRYDHISNRVRKLTQLIIVEPCRMDGSGLHSGGTKHHRKSRLWTGNGRRYVKQ